MTKGIELLEQVYGQLREAGLVRSKGDFSKRLLGKSPSYLTSMRAKQRVVSSDVIMVLGDAIIAEIRELGSDPAHAEDRAALRRAMVQVNLHLADQFILAIIAQRSPRAREMAKRRRNGIMNWLRALVSGSPATSSNG